MFRLDNRYDEVRDDLEFTKKKIFIFYRYNFGFPIELNVLRHINYINTGGLIFNVLTRIK